jgi:hypothetical protein
VAGLESKSLELGSPTFDGAVNLLEVTIIKAEWDTLKSKNSRSRGQKGAGFKDLWQKIKRKIRKKT